MKTKLGLMAACAAMAMAAETGNAQRVVWTSGGQFYLSVGTPCPPPRVVTCVPVMVTQPACAWGSGTRAVIVPSYPQRIVYVSPPVYRHPPVAACRPAYVQSRPSHGYRGDSHPRSHRR